MAESMSFFGNHPRVLQLEEPDVMDILDFELEIPVIPKLELLTYL